MTSGSRWSLEDDAELRNNPHLPASVLAAKLGRSESAVGGRRHNLGLSKRRDWTEREDEYLRNTCAPIREQSSKLGRTEASIRHRRHELGISKSRRWTTDQERFLAENPRMTADQISTKIGKSAPAIHIKRRQLGISGYIWTVEEDEFLRKNPDMPIAEAAVRLNRSHYAVMDRRRVVLPSHRRKDLWRPDQLAFLRKNPKMPSAEAAKKIGKTVHAVNHKRKDLGLSSRRRNIPWTKDDDALLTKRRHEGVKAKSIAKEMQRTLASIHVRMQILELSTPRSELSWDKRQLNVIKKNVNTPATELAKMVGKSPGAVRTMRRKANLPKYQEHRPWDDSELDTLQANLDLKLAEIYALFPYRSKNSVSAMAMKLGRVRHNRKGYSYSSGYRGSVKGSKFVGDHRVIAERMLGRKLNESEKVHHINGIKHDNRPENLDVMPNQSVHMKAHKSIHEVVPKLIHSGALAYDRKTNAYFVSKRSR